MNKADLCQFDHLIIYSEQAWFWCQNYHLNPIKLNSFSIQVCQFLPVHPNFCQILPVCPKNHQFLPAVHPKKFHISQFLLVHPKIHHICQFLPVHPKISIFANFCLCIKKFTIFANFCLCTQKFTIFANFGLCIQAFAIFANFGLCILLCQNLLLSKLSFLCVHNSATVKVIIFVHPKFCHCQNCNFCEFTISPLSKLYYLQRKEGPKHEYQRHKWPWAWRVASPKGEQPLAGAQIRICVVAFYSISFHIGSYILISEMSDISCYHQMSGCCNFTNLQ